MLTQGKAAYYTLAGGFMGAGIVTIFSIGIGLFLLGLVLALYGRIRIGSRMSWLVLVGMGTALLLFLLYYLFVPDSTAVGDPASYLPVALLFLAITLGGAVCGIIDERRRHTVPGQTLGP